MLNCYWRRHRRRRRLVKEPFGIVTELLHAVRAAEVVGLPLVVVGAGRGLWIYRHTANRIQYNRETRRSCCHWHSCCGYPLLFSIRSDDPLTDLLCGEVLFFL